MDYARLNESLTDEYKDVVKYAGIYKESGNAIFRDMAREEAIHAKHIKAFLQEAGELVAAPELEAKAQATLDEI